MRTSGGAAERVQERFGAGEAAARLVELAEHDSRPDVARSCGQRHLAEQRVEDRRLATSVRAGQRDALAPVEAEVERAEPEAPPFDDRLLEPRHDLAASVRGRERNVQLPRLVRLLDGLHALELLRVRLLHVLRLLLLAALAVAALLPLAHARGLLLDAAPLLDRALPARVLPAAGTIALGLVLAPAAGVLLRLSGPLVELEDARHGAVEKLTVVRDDHDARG